MNTIQKGVIALIRSALTQQAQPLPEGFSLAEAMPVIRHHHVTPLAFEGTQICGLPQDPILFQSYCKALQISTGQLRTLEGLFAAFDAAGIDYMPLKGCNMKPLYPKPELRIMGDADVLIRMEQYDRIVPVMESLGFVSKLETDPEMVWGSSGLHLELHKRLFAPHNRDFYAYFGDGWGRAQKRMGILHDMTPEDTWIYLFTHFAKHYRDGGIGCRHVVDLWVYRRANPGMDEAYIAAELKKLQLLEFHDNVCRLLNVWFEDGDMDECTAVLSVCIFSSGSWGRSEEHIRSQMIKESKHSVFGFSGRLVYLKRLLFPNFESMCQLYPFLKKASWLLPVMWMIRLIYKVLFESWKLKEHGRKMRAVSRKKLENSREMLRYVGLDYNF